VKKPSFGPKEIIAKNVDEYLEALPERERLTLEKLRKMIKAAAPQAQEVISYRMPAYKYHGPLVFFAAFKNHLSLYGVSKTTVEKFRGELEPFEISGTTIHFSTEKPLSAALVKKLVKARLKENEARDKGKKK
jgi:uncharacterized protein YdhG (YjbR/CyaY superfamily)